MGVTENISTRIEVQGIVIQPVLPHPGFQRVLAGGAQVYCGVAGRRHGAPIHYRVGVIPKGLQ